MLLNYIKKYKFDIIETFKLSLPIIFGRLGAVLIGVIDSIMIGRLGYEELAAVGIANSVFILVGILPIGFLIVGSPMISAAYSKNNKPECVQVMKGCMQFATILSVIFMGVMLLLAYNFHWFNQTEEVNTLAVPYLYLLVGSTLPLMIFIAIEQFSDGLESTRVSMFFNVTALFVNAFINWLFIYGSWGFPQLGVLGAGIGTITARIYMCVGIWLVVNNMEKFKSFDLRIQLLKIDKLIFRQLLKNGIPSGMQFFFEVSAFSLAAIMAGWLGTIQLAAHNVAISLASITYMLSTGFATGASIRVGTAYGMKDKEGLINAGKSAMILVVFLMSLSCLGFILFNSMFVGLYTQEPDVIKIASSLLIIAGLFQIADGIQVVAIRSLLGINDVNIPTMVSLGAYWIVGIPLGYLLCFNFGYGVFGIWLGLTAGICISAIVLAQRFFTKVKLV